MKGSKQHLAEPRAIYDGWGILLSMDNNMWLGEERELHNTADQQGKAECQQCGWCCLKRPCTPTPDELERIAEYLGMSPGELIRTKCVVDQFAKGGRFYVLWAKETQLDLLGQYVPCSRTYDQGYCVFFNRETHNCRIHEVRPESARSYECWGEVDYLQKNNEHMLIISITIISLAVNIYCSGTKSGYLSNHAAGQSHVLRGHFQFEISSASNFSICTLTLPHSFVSISLISAKLILPSIMTERQSMPFLTSSGFSRRESDTT